MEPLPLQIEGALSLRCTACTFYTVIASFFVRDIQILSDMPLKDGEIWKPSQWSFLTFAGRTESTASSSQQISRQAFQRIFEQV